ncbi:MAG: hypothetical protein HY371_03030 [Devosia nanyangense]|nr:hypothetical protein [Devosia nanyangense]
MVEAVQFRRKQDQKDAPKAANFAAKPAKDRKTLVEIDSKFNDLQPLTTSHTQKNQWFAVYVCQLGCGKSMNFRRNRFAATDSTAAQDP